MMIYKYLSIAPKSANPIAPVKDRTLKFALVPDLNDPFENLPKVTMTEDTLQEKIKESKELIHQQPAFSHISVEKREEFAEIAATSLKTNYDGANHDISEFLHQRQLAKNTAKNIGILSLTRNARNGLMWSHYCDKHRGYVLGFDDNHPWFNPPENAGKFLGRLIPIEYKNDRVELNAGVNSEKQAFAPFFRKSYDWEYEEELRVLAPLSEIKKINDLLYVREYPAEMLKEVIFGVDMPDTQIADIKGALSEFTHVKYFRSMPSSKNYDVEIIPNDKYFNDPLDEIKKHRKIADSLRIDTTKL